MLQLCVALVTRFPFLGHFWIFISKCPSIGKILDICASSYGDLNFVQYLLDIKWLNLSTLSNGDDLWFSCKFYRSSCCKKEFVLVKWRRFLQWFELLGIQFVCKVCFNIFHLSWNLSWKHWDTEIKQSSSSRSKRCCYLISATHPIRMFAIKLIRFGLKCSMGLFNGFYG